MPDLRPGREVGFLQRDDVIRRCADKAVGRRHNWRGDFIREPWNLAYFTVGQFLCDLQCARPAERHLWQGRDARLGEGARLPPEMMPEVYGGPHLAQPEVRQILGY